MTILNYWVEETDRVWIKVPSIPENDSITINVKKTGDYSPSGDDTFEFFDDFSGSSLDTDKWEITHDSGASTGSVSVGSGLLSLYGAGVKSKNLTFGYGFSIKSKMRETANSGTNTASRYGHVQVGFNRVHGTERDDDTFGIYVNPDHTVRRRIVGITGKDGTFETEESVEDAEHNVWYKLEAARFSASLVKTWWYDEDEDYTFTTNIPTINLPATLSCRNGTSVQHTGGGDYDWVFVRKIVDDEPSISVTDQTTHYEVTINNTGGDELTDYQISVDASDLGTLANDESLKIEEDDFVSGATVKIKLNGTIVEKPLMIKTGGVVTQASAITVKTT